MIVTMMIFKPTVFFLICVVCLLENNVVMCFQRNVQKQITRLEKRYELDLSQTKESIEDLWTALDTTHAKCCAGNVQVVKSYKVSNNDASTSINMTEFKNILRVMNRAFSEEKSYLRGRWEEMLEELERREENMEDMFEGMASMNANLMKSCEDTKHDVGQIRIQLAGINDRINQIELDSGKLIKILSEHLNTFVDEMRPIISLHRPGSCMELIEAGITKSGVYQLFHDNQPFIVFCLMYGNHGYTFISPETSMNIDVSRLSNDQSHVIIRHRRTNGHQYHTRLEQLNQYKSRAISVQFNSHTGYTGISNWKLSPYIYVGINPKGGNQKGQTQGYRANSKDVQFRNCDNNPNGYFVFLFNHGGESLHNSGFSPAVAQQWKNTASMVKKDKIPDKFMSKFELHFGGCGAYATSDHFSDVKMAAVGIPYKMV